MAKGYFVTATDTGAGKTLITAGLVEAFTQQGLRAVALKPVASGCQHTDEGLRNEDASYFIQHAPIELDYAQVNPYAFEPPISPNIAAREAGVEIELPRLLQIYRDVAAMSDRVLVEGVGGWKVPLSDEVFVSDLAAELGLAVIVVVPLRLGCINHALLTLESIAASGVEIAGWVPNMLDRSLTHVPDVIDTINRHSAAPALGIIPPLQSPLPKVVAQHITLDLLEG